MLYTKPIPNNEKFLPSPADLQGFIIVKVILKHNLLYSFIKPTFVDFYNICVTTFIISTARMGKIIIL